MCHLDKRQNTPYILAKRNAKHSILKLLLENGAKAYNDEFTRAPYTDKNSKKNKLAKKPVVEKEAAPATQSDKK